jgi:hypothetical protein
MLRRPKHSKNDVVASKEEEKYTELFVSMLHISSLNN